MSKSHGTRAGEQASHRREKSKAVADKKLQDSHIPISYINHTQIGYRRLGTLEFWRCEGFGVQIDHEPRTRTTFLCSWSWLPGWWFFGGDDGAMLVVIYIHGYPFPCYPPNSRDILRSDVEKGVRNDQGQRVTPNRKTATEQAEHFSHRFFFFLGFLRGFPNMWMVKPAAHCLRIGFTTPDLPWTVPCWQ